MISDWLEERVEDFLMDVFHAGIVALINVKTEKRGRCEVVFMQYALQKFGDDKLWWVDVKAVFENNSLRKIEAELRKPNPEEVTVVKQIFWEEMGVAEE